MSSFLIELVSAVEVLEAAICAIIATPPRSSISYFCGMIHNFTNTIKIDTPNADFLLYQLRIEYDTVKISSNLHRNRIKIWSYRNEYVSGELFCAYF
jgi:hypothetical protein